MKIKHNHKEITKKFRQTSSVTITFTREDLLDIYYSSHWRCESDNDDSVAVTKFAELLASISVEEE